MKNRPASRSRVLRLTIRGFRVLELQGSGIEGCLLQGEAYRPRLQSSLVQGRLLGGSWLNVAYWVSLSLALRLSFRLSVGIKVFALGCKGGRENLIEYIQVGLMNFTFVYVLATAVMFTMTSSP